MNLVTNPTFRNQSVYGAASAGHRTGTVETSQQLPNDQLSGSVEPKLPGKPQFAPAGKSSPSQSKGFKSGKVVTYLVTAALIGTLGLGLFHSAHAQPPIKERPAATQVVKQDASGAYQAGQALNQVGKQVQTEAVKQAKEIKTEAVKQGKEVAGQAKEVGQQAAKVGKEIGQVGKEFGLGVAKEATSFWKGLTGK